MLTISSFSQKFEPDFTKEIIVLNAFGKEIISNTDDEAKYAANEKFKSALKELIQKNGSFDYQFDSLKTISILKAHQLKIYNWTIPLNDGVFEYFAFLQVKEDKDNFIIIELTDKSDEIKTPETKLLTAKNWYGALYYKIIYDKKLGENYYTVLGWDGNNNLSNKKIIDVINIGNNGMVKIGAPIFKYKSKTQKRVIFEYSKEFVMSLRYHQNEEIIIFDHLVPASSHLKGVYEYYGPSLEMFDAFRLNKGKWIYEEDIDAKLDRSIKDSMWNDPKK
jgi:hypothetical protein